MPQWGLTEEQRKSKPWGIDGKWLEPGKVITDPIHGDIYVTELEQALIDSSPFQRLRRIRQLGTVHLVYPGATHTRFAHALGALRVVQDLLDIVLGQRSGRHRRQDLFQQWADELAATDPEELDKQIAQVVVLARLGALLHDFCHVAYGHSIEDELHILKPHDENKERFDEFWAMLGDRHEEFAAIQRLLNRRQLKLALQALILSKETKEPPDERLRRQKAYPFVADMVGNTICADLIDYLERDHAYTGLPAALGERFMTAFYVVPAGSADQLHYPERLALRIARDGRERRDIKTELLKYLRFRYELQERALVHHAKLAADAMLGKLLDLWHNAEWIDRAAERQGAETNVVLSLEAAPLPAVRSAFVEDHGQPQAKALDADVTDVIERRLRRLGDDGLLEFLAGDSAHPDTAEGWEPSTARWALVQRLARDLRDRKLYRRAAQAADAWAHDRLYELFEGPGKRRELERQAAAFAGVDPQQVILWVPNPKMRMKIAEVLVDDGSTIAPFNDYSDQAGDIYNAHRDLWTITVFVDREITEHEPTILARLAELMGIDWDRCKPRHANQPADWPLARAAEVVAADSRPLARATSGLDQPEPDPDFDAEVRDLLKQVRQNVHRGDAETFQDLLGEVRSALGRMRRRGPRRPS